ETKTVTTRYGVAWVRMNSATSAGAAQLEASAAGLSQKRVVQQVPGDPCNINMTAKPSKDDRVVLETAPVKDCRGNPVPDGTIVTFSETANGTQSTVDVPLKRGVARTEMPAQEGAVISVAAGVVLGNEIRWKNR